MIVLHYIKILIQVKDLAWNEFKINIDNYPTTPSLSFALYRKNYLQNYKIPIINGNLYKELKESYTSGSTDLFVPHSYNVKIYDVKSQYPSSMYKNNFPIGNTFKFSIQVF